MTIILISKGQEKAEVVVKGQKTSQTVHLRLQVQGVCKGLFTSKDGAVQVALEDRAAA